MVQLDKAITEKWELGVACILNLWPALSIAVANQWGGSDSEGKRDWFCGAIADLFTDAEGSGGETQKEPELDELDVEEVLLQVMQDEFEVGVDDDTSFAVGLNLLPCDCVRRG